MTTHPPTWGGPFFLQKYSTCDGRKNLLMNESLCSTCRIPVKRGQIHHCQQTLGQQLERQRAWRRAYDRRRRAKAARRVTVAAR